jgi:UDP-N-acetylglucosamine 2-epimerase (non-hydrolysing)
MRKPRVVSIFGTRPEATKMAPVVLALKDDPELEHQLVITAQHRKLLDDVLEMFDLTADHDLNLMQARQSLEHVMSGVLTGISAFFEQQRPDIVLVHGDTTTTFAAALAAFYHHIPVGHVEAGLRTSTVTRPFPEELNRRLADVIAAHYYCPTLGAAKNLTANRDLGGRIFITGNTALDAVRLVQDSAYDFAEDRLDDFTAHPGPRIVVTAHRRENWGEPLASICAGLLGLLEDFPAARVCFCWHPNPAVREVVQPLLGEHPRVLLVDPPRFDAFANLVAQCDLVLTDSGGIQEEITQLRRYALVLRDETERPEAVEAGFARLVGTAAEDIRAAAREVLPLTTAPARGGTGELPAHDAISPFGDGRAAERIHAAVRFALGLSDAPAADYL